MLPTNPPTPATQLPFYSGDWIVQRLCADAASWVGTPFVPHSQVRNAGVDCIHLVAAIYESTGFMDGFHPPPYAIDAGNTNHESQILEWLQQNRQFTSVFQRGNRSPSPGGEGRGEGEPAINSQPSTLESLLPGDLLLFRFGATEHHCGLLLGRKKFVHAPFAPPARVTIDSLTDPIYARMLTFAFRPLTPGPREVMG